MIARNLIPGGRLLAWLLASVLAVLLASCKTGESDAPATASTNLTVPAQEVSLLALPASLVPAGATVNWSLNNGPATSAIIPMFYPWSSTSVQFWPPVEGTYEFTAIVRYAGHVLRKKVEVTVTPQATIGFNVPINATTTLAMPPAEIPAGATAFTWEVVSSPEAASYTLTPGASTVDFTPVTPGTYAMLVSMTTPDGVRKRMVFVSATGFGRIDAASFEPVDARFSQFNNRLLLLDKTAAVLHVYAIDSGTMTNITLPGVGNTLALSPNGLVALVGQETRVTRVNISSMTVVDSITTNRRYASLAIDDAGLAVGVPTGSGLVPIDTLNFATGTLVRSSTLPAAAAPASNTLPASSQVIAGGGRFYALSRTGDPTELKRLEFVGGVARVAYDSPYNGDYPMSGGLWITESGHQLTTGAGTIFLARDVGDDEIDLSFWEDFGVDGEPIALRWDDYSPEVGLDLVIREDPHDTPGAAGLPEVEFYSNLDDAEEVVPMPLTRVGGRAYVSRAMWGFFSRDGSQYVVVTRARDTARLANSRLAGGWSILVR